MALERIVLVIGLVLLGWVIIQWYKQRQISRINPTSDPLLESLRPDVASIVYFTTPGCIPCRTQQQPALAQLQSELGEMLQVVRIDATQETEVADRWGVLSAPTTFILDRQRRVQHVNFGVADAQQLKQQLKAIKAIE